MQADDERLHVIETIPSLPLRPADAHKGQFGRVLIVGGSVGMAGAAGLAANAALRAGAGLVRVFCPAAILPTVAAIAPCATSTPAAQTFRGRFSLAARGHLLLEAAANDVLAVGPGMGVSAGCARLVEAAITETDTPVVLDADGLNNLAWLGPPGRIGGPLILTPHPGEMRRLLGAFQIDVTLSADEASRVAAARAVADRLGCIVVLKGAGTVVTDGARLYVNKTGNPGMATGGSGDILTGTIAALLGQKLSPLEAAVLGVYLHGLAGDVAAERLGQVSATAADLLDALPEAFQRHRKPSPEG